MLRSVERLAEDLVENSVAIWIPRNTYPPLPPSYAPDGAKKETECRQDITIRCLSTTLIPFSNNMRSRYLAGISYLWNNALPALIFHGRSARSYRKRNLDDDCCIGDKISPKQCENCLVRSNVVAMTSLVLSRSPALSVAFEIFFNLTLNERALAWSNAVKYRLLQHKVKLNIEPAAASRTVRTTRDRAILPAFRSSSTMLFRYFHATTGLQGVLNMRAG